MKRTQKGLGFEKCFGEFIDRMEYDMAENALFSIIDSELLGKLD